MVNGDQDKSRTIKDRVQECSLQKSTEPERVHTEALWKVTED